MVKYSLKKNTGFTLIEVILSIAILGIIAAAFIPVFTGGFKGIIFAGEVKTGMFNSQDTIEQQISAETKTGSSVNVAITFPAVSGKSQYNISRNAITATDGSYLLFSTPLN